MSSYGDVLPVCLWKFHQTIFAVPFFHPKTSQTPVARTGVIAMPDVVRIQQLESSSGEVSHGLGMDASINPIENVQSNGVVPIYGKSLGMVFGKTSQRTSSEGTSTPSMVRNRATAGFPHCYW